MGSYPFILLLVALTASFSNGFKMTLLEEMQALHFEEIGELKLIKSYKAISFQINIRTFAELIKNAKEHFELVKDMFNNDTSTNEKLDTIKLVLELKEMEFKDIVHGLVKTKRNVHSRKKREFMGLLSTEDGRKISLDLNNLRSKSNEIVGISNSLKSVAHNTTILMNKTVEELNRRTAMMNLLDVKNDIERIIKAITKMLNERRLNTEIIPITEVQKDIKNITLKIEENEELPYHKLMDYYYNLPLNYKISEDIIVVEVDVPIVEKDARKLFKIVEIPARNEGKLIMTDVIWKYIAENDNETVVFMTMDVCLKSQYNGTMYFCKSQSPIKNKNATDCLNNAIAGSKTIDMNLCKYSAAQTTSLMFIKLNDGEYFYYTPINETLTVTCGADTIDEILVENTSGIIMLEPECIALTGTYKLITTMRFGPTTQTKINVVRVFFNIDELKENMRKYNTPHVDKFYIESLGLLRDMSKPIKSVEKLDHINFGTMNSDFMSISTILAWIIIVVYVLYSLMKWKKNKSAEAENIIKKRPLEEPVEIYVLKE
ncbi:unnamed protein product [Chironomus riparius]|uniref:Uncharacterized protein n=1 Tax=Chironomus riparius TaxID=315576 RepID=A0A9N9WWL2_9DIPT|nr:unnamed protein product [Chironomus riparius]